MNSTSFLISQVNPRDIEEHITIHTCVYIEGVNILTGSCEMQTLWITDLRLKGLQ